jgi:hypothetical protein
MIRKKLSLNDLRVDSFETTLPEGSRRGTVKGHADPETRCTGARTGCGSNEGSYDILTCPGGDSNDGFCPVGTLHVPSNCCDPYGSSVEYSYCGDWTCSVQTCGGNTCDSAC